ncbi:molybdenum ABC transporter molybdate-binding protein [Prosthecobacter fusiformis]|uniref:Molybdenum ABC transporter molybdate-binding protein n=1 Tax=Prosthecobacter fusiformis TaxID=48464 RepID=A0A4R7S5S0_9BACT|nr:molybdate ABC transporter substrate-binding protein [Prosthecobacter fusiformis]TDU72888.1 molybdenum ABC transporter molybdate-binding protein [Prosthecobacter fusiformis]
MPRKLIALVLILAAGALAFYGLRPGSRSTQQSLTVYCAAGLKKPVEAVAAQYEKEMGVPVSLQFGGTGTLLTQLRVANRGDLFIAADDGSLADARKLEVTQELLPIAVQHAVIAVAKGNPKGIRSLADLEKPDVRLALTNPEAASIGKITQKLLGDRWETLAKTAAVMKPTVAEVAADTQLGAVDASIVWDSVIGQFKGLEMVKVPELSSHAEKASVAVLTSAASSAEALKFARYLAAPEKGGAVFKELGFLAAGGDKWSAKPELILYSGGVNRPAIEKLVQDFATREGISITTVFNGCGILCAAMKTMEDSSSPKFPDVYYACDVCFVPPVAEHFPEAVLLTEAQIVIAVPKGNPKNIQTLADLAREGLRVGICNAEQSTLGFMTQGILKSMNLWESVSKNASSQVPTGDFLVNQLRTGSLDAAVVYQINIQNQADHFDSIPLPADKAKAVQPFAVRTNSPNKQLGNRMLAYLKNHQKSFTDAGFVWRGDTPAVKSSELEIPEWLKQK